MSLVQDIGVLILTHNEAPNIARTLSKLDWARQVLIVDSGSTDATIEIARTYPNVEIATRAFDDFASQCNFGLSKLDTPWVLSLDADYELSDGLVVEFGALAPPSDVAGYRAGFIYRVYGKSLRGTLYPPRVVLFRRENASYRNEGHSHRVVVDGGVLPLRSPIYHDDRKSLARWFSSQQRYAGIEAEYLLRAEKGDLTRVDRIRLLAGPAPFAAFIYTLLAKRCMFDGRAGWLYALQRMLAESMLALEITDRKLRRTSKEP